MIYHNFFSFPSTKNFFFWASCNENEIKRAVESHYTNLHEHFAPGPIRLPLLKMHNQTINHARRLFFPAFVDAEKKAKQKEGTA